MGYICGTARKQTVMFPRTLDEYIDENNAVRAIDAFIEYLRFAELGFVRGEPAETGRPGYDPRALLGIFIWGHLNRVRSSRRLEQECGRNVELMWLSGQLQPDFKTLCRFRQENGEAINKLIASVAVTNEVTDQELLAAVAQQTKAELGVEELSVVADGGYFGCEVIKACEDEKITAYVPVPELGDAKRRGLFTREEFAYDADRDVYVCPQGAELTVMSRTSKKARYQKEFRVYATKQCQGCPLRAQCTTSKYGRRIKRWVHHEVLERLQARMRAHPEMMARRKALSEHPFGTIKVAMNHERLLLKGLKHVATEIKLTVLSYNLKRVMSILGVATLIEKLKLQPV